ncbi:MAG: hypothetical protein HZR80_21090 [Candidatus Heimdallarchaeota archaeon]
MSYDEKLWIARNHLREGYIPSPEQFQKLRKMRLLSLLEKHRSMIGDFECGLISNEEMASLEEEIEPLFQELIVKEVQDK